MGATISFKFLELQPPSFAMQSNVPTWHDLVNPKIYAVEVNGVISYHLSRKRPCDDQWRHFPNTEGMAEWSLRDLHGTILIEPHELEADIFRRVAQYITVLHGQVALFRTPRASGTEINVEVDTSICKAIGFARDVFNHDVRGKLLEWEASEQNKPQATQHKKLPYTQEEIEFMVKCYNTDPNVKHLLDWKSAPPIKLVGGELQD